MKTNIVEYITGLQEGGAETLVKDYAMLLNSDLFNVIVVTNNPNLDNYENYQILRDAGANIISIYEKPKVFPNRMLEILWNRLFHKRYIGKRLLEIIRDNEVDVLHAHLEVLSYISPIRKQLKGVKLFFTCHNEPSVIFRKVRWKNELKSVSLLIRDNNLRMIALHDNMRQELNRLFNVSNTIVVHNGIDFTRFRSVEETKEEIRLSEQIPSDAFVVGNVGRFSEAKNHRYLIDIFKIIKSRRKDAHLLLVGSGPLEEQIRHKLQDLSLTSSCTILQHRTDIPRLLKAMDVFLFPSIYEGLPVTMVEAQVSGLRVVASNRITSECFFSERAVPLSIEESPELWAKVVLNDSITGEIQNDIDEFNMSKVIEHLQSLYSE